MELPKYKSNRKLSWNEICDDFPDIAKQIVDEDNWAMYEQKPDFSEVDNKLMQWIPEKVRNR